MFDDELVTIFDTISLMLFDTELTVAPLPARAFDPRALTGSIEFTGSFRGNLSATFGEPLARKLAASMLGKRAADVSEEELRDAVGELVNIAAGNLKGVLPERCRLSLPSVHEQGPLSATDVALTGKAMLAMFGEPVFVCLRQPADRGG